ncbi:MAG: outer membrane lipoprotein-sorting protein [Candidatus Binatia bacterium]|nr:outer membrane lipoprotein-sorting protein [Candidatus Binatia bacterium]
MRAQLQSWRLVGACALASTLAIFSGRIAQAADPNGLAPGSVLGKDNWQLAENLLPPEILRHYREGHYQNKIIDWPEGIYRWDPRFLAASEANRGRYTTSPEGTIIDAATGRQPAFVYGLPFPDIDPGKDPAAAVKILWNFFYQYWNEGSSHNLILLAWVRPDGVDREAIQDVYFLYYDGQDPDYRLPNPNNFSMQFVAVATSPADLHGTASLTWRYRDSNKRDSNWTYVPALRRVRAVSPANRSDGFLGSDMSQDDGPFFDGKPEDFTWSFVGEGETLRIVDPESFERMPQRYWLPEGGWRTVWTNLQVVGFQTPDWKGIAWAPVRAALAKRKVWIIQGVPKDRYYLYGRIELHIDKETYQGAWNRKFGWNGEHLNTLQIVAYQRDKNQRPDGAVEHQWSSHFSFQCAENVKLNRATLGGLTPPGKDIANDRKVRFPATFFDSATLNRFGK